MTRFARGLFTGLLALIVALPLAIGQARAAYTQAELDQMLAPIALYPDPLLSQILMAATYPVEVEEAAQWSRANPGLQGDAAVQAVQDLDWDPSVKSLVAFPHVLARMAENPDWTRSLGDAFIVQEPQVMETVQALRRRAQAAGQLASDERIRVVEQAQSIAIVPANPQIVYVPYYDPWVAYGPWWWSAYPPVVWAPWPGYARYYRPGLSVGFWWGAPIGISTGFFFGGVDWQRRHVRVVHVDNYYVRPAVVERTVIVAPGRWRHDPSHRRGIAYRDPAAAQQRFAAPAPQQQTGAPAQQQQITVPAPRQQFTAPAQRRMERQEERHRNIGTSRPGMPATETPRVEIPRAEPPRRESTRTETPRFGAAPQREVQQSEPSRTDRPLRVAPRTEAPRAERPRQDPQQVEPRRSEASHKGQRAEPRREEPGQQGQRPQERRQEIRRAEPRSETRPQEVRRVENRVEAQRQEAVQAPRPAGFARGVAPAPRIERQEIRRAEPQSEARQQEIRRVERRVEAQRQEAGQAPRSAGFARGVAPAPRVERQERRAEARSHQEHEQQKQGKDRPSR